jgi:hypothetical protein
VCGGYGGGFATFFDNWKYSMCARCLTRHTSIRYSSSCLTHVNMRTSIFFTNAMVRALRSERSRGNSGTNTRSLTLHEMHVEQQLQIFSPGTAILSLHIL